MKTPREVLFARHRNVERRLDAIRERILAQAFPAEEAPSSLHAAGVDRSRSSVGLLSWMSRLWWELILPSRGAWCALAGVWVIIVALNLASADAPKNVPKQSSASTLENQVAVREQRLLRLELLGLSMPSSAATLPSVVPPRSERRERALFA